MDSDQNPIDLLQREIKYLRDCVESPNVMPIDVLFIRILDVLQVFTFYLERMK